MKHEAYPEYDLAVIGGGSGGVRAARVAAAYGARVKVVAGGRTFFRQLANAHGYLQQSSAILHVGLGAATAVDRVEVQWPGVATPQVVEAVFAPEVIAGRELRTVELSPGKVVALGVAAHEPARARPLEEVRAQVIESARLEAAAKLSAARAKELVDELRNGAAWGPAVARWAGEAGTQVPKTAGRQEAAIPAEIRDAAFRAPRPAPGKPSYGTAALANGDTAVWTVTAAEPGKLAATTTEAGRRARDEARDRLAMTDATVYIAAMRASSEVDVNPQLFE
jgi:peptidyl-prolyl cis-trans isomerase D